MKKKTAVGFIKCMVCILLFLCIPKTISADETITEEQAYAAMMAM